MSGIDCVQKTSRRQPCNKKENFCNVDILMSSVVRHGKWVCHGVRCNLYCEVRRIFPPYFVTVHSQVGYLSSGSEYVCSGQNRQPKQQCLPAQLTASDHSRSLVVSQDRRGGEGEVCRTTWQYTRPPTDVKYLWNGTSTTFSVTLSPQQLIFQPEDILSVSIPRSQHIKYPELHPSVGLLFKTSNKMSNSLSVNSSMCHVQISADTLLVVAHEVVMVRQGPTLEWVPLPPLAKPRKFHACALLPSGAVLVAGGSGIEDDQLVTETEILDIGRGNLQWETSASISERY